MAVFQNGRGSVYYKRDSVFAEASALNLKHCKLARVGYRFFLCFFFCIAGSTVPVASRAVTMSAVARDSPETMGEAGDTPRCPMLQREWLGEGQRCSLTRHKSGKRWSHTPSGITTTAW